MKQIIAYAKENTKYMYSAIVLLMMSTVFGIIPYFLLNNIIMSVLEGTFTWESTLTLICYIGGSLLLKGALFGGGLGLSHIGAFNTLYNMRVTFAKDMARQPMGHILDEGTGKYKKTFVEDISLLESALAHMIPEGVPYICGVSMTILVIFTIDWRLGLAILVTIPISMLPMAFMMKVGLEKMPKYYESRDVLNHTLVEFVSGMEVIKVFNKVTKSYDKLAQAVGYSRDYTLDWCKVTWKSTSVLYALLPCTLLVPLPLGIYFYMNGSILLSDFILVMMLGLSLGEPLIKMISFMPSIPMLTYNIKKIEAVFKHDDVQNGSYDQMSVDTSVSFENVNFAYKEKDVIKDVTFNISPNSICALVGSSGSGKSTLAKLLMHFWDVREGCIKIGERDIREFTFSNLMNHISYVSQENTLFNGTIYDNIAISRDGITKEEIIKACKEANCHEFISQLPNGYETNVGALGGKLSGGERQRITIARAIIKNAPIVVLDEVTAFADAENEFLIQEALSKLLVGKTVLIIAHKLHTITDVDQIIVLDQGEIETAGTHDELLECSAIYKKLWRQNQVSVEWNLGGGTNV